jgi:hypothetical protein
VSNTLAITPTDPEDITNKGYVDNKVIDVAHGGTGLTGTPANGQLPIGNGIGFALGTLTAGSGISIANGAGTITISAAGGSGTVTSVGLSLPSIFSVTGSPVTTTGTLTATLQTQTANTVFSGPSSGGAATPTFRTLTATDIPNLDTSKLTSGVLPVARGGTETSNRTLVNSGSTTTVNWESRTLSGGDWTLSAGANFGTSSSTVEGTLRFDSGDLEVYKDGDWRCLVLNLRKESEINEDWTSGSTTGAYGWVSTLVGTGAVALSSVNMDAAHLGVVDLTVSTNADVAILSLNANTIQLGGGSYFNEWSVYIPTLAAVGQDYVLRCGFGDSSTSADHVDGVYFEYNRSLSVNWAIKTANNSTRTTGTVGSPVAVAAATWTKLGYIVNAAGTSVQFYLNGTAYGTAITTNIPITAGRDVAPSAQLIKTNSNTARSVSIDYFRGKTRFTTAR